MQQPIETTSALADLGAAPLSPAISRIQNNVFTYQRSKAAKFLHLVSILHFTAYTLPRVAPMHYIPYFIYIPYNFFFF